MPMTMKGAPLPSWRNEPLPRYNKFSADGGGGSAWPVWDGTLGSFCGSQDVVNDKFFESLRIHKQISNNAAWKTYIERHPTFRRIPKRMRPGISGDDLGPTHVE